MENKPILGFVTMESLARFIFSKVSFALLNRYNDLRTGLNVVKAIGHGQSTQADDYDKHPWYIEDAMSIYTGPGPAQQDELNVLVALKHKSEILNTDSRMIQKAAVYHITTTLSDAHTHVIIIVRYPKQTDWLTGLDEVITDEGFDVTMDVVDEHGDHIEPNNVPRELHDDVICIAEVTHEIRSTLKNAVSIPISHDGKEIPKCSLKSTAEPKDEQSTTISNILRKYNLSTDDTALPDIKIGEFTLERSKLPKFTAEDLKVAKEAFDASNHVYGIAHELESQLIEASNAAAREVDKWILDIFKTIYGCKSFDDVYLKMTHQQYLTEFKHAIEHVNERLEYIDNSQDKWERDGDTITYYPLHGYRLSVPQEPVKPSEELYQNLKSLWEEVYNEN